MQKKKKQFLQLQLQIGICLTTDSRNQMANACTTWVPIYFQLALIAALSAFYRLWIAGHWQVK
jgi:hypothetical protein